MTRPTSQHRRLDELARMIVFERDRYRCRRCGAQPVFWAHVHSRRWKATKWNPDNAMALCASCHEWFDTHKRDGMAWWAETVAPDVPERLYEALRNPDAPDLDAIEAELFCAMADAADWVGGIE